MVFARGKSAFVAGRLAPRWLGIGPHIFCDLLQLRGVNILTKANGVDARLIRAAVVLLQDRSGVGTKVSVSQQKKFMWYWI